METLLPSVTTKMCIAGAAVYILYAEDATYVFLVGLFVAMKVCPALGVPFEPFKKVEDALAPIFFGDSRSKTD